MNKQFVSIHISHTAPQCTSFLQLLLNVIYSSDMEFSHSFVVLSESETDLQVREVFNHVFSSRDYNTAILSKQSHSCLIIQFSRVQSETCSYALCNTMSTIIFTAADGISKQGAQLLLE